jgi:hypothetical protein
MTMKAKDVKLDELYVAKVSGELTAVYLKEENPRGGWYGINQKTGREIEIKTAGRLRRRYTPGTIPI